MSTTSRRTVLTALAATAVSGPLLTGIGAAPAYAADDLYASNTDLYTKLAGPVTGPTEKPKARTTRSSTGSPGLRPLRRPAGVTRRQAEADG